MQKMKHLVLILCALPVAWTAEAQAGTLQPSIDGTVTDTATGLVWKRCREGQAWTGKICTGSATTYTFDQATALTGKVPFAGQNDWRVPSIRELLSIVDDTVVGPAMDKIAFPNDVVSYVWSGSPYADASSSAWFVYFGYGRASYVNRSSNSFSVRLVRGGQSLATLNLARPTADYIDNRDGTATHIPTQLMWQRCALGRSWDGNTCVGLASNMSWDSAVAATSNLAGKADWRLPTRQELLTLVDYTNVGTAFNASIFPNTLAPDFWSSSPYANNASSAWWVSFYEGYVDQGSRSDFMSVRLVRGGQSSAPLSPLSDADCFLEWAEARLPDLLKPAHAPTQTAGAIQYRAYSATGIYVGVDGGTSVLALGGTLGANVVTLGALSDFLPAARAALCK